MIIGIGSDIIDIRRIERTVERFGDRFLQRVFTDVERAKAESLGIEIWNGETFEERLRSGKT